MARLDTEAGVQVFGRYVVADPEICHGQLTFRGTRIFVKVVLEQVARGAAWDQIVQEWRGAITQDAIGEAVRMAREALLTQRGELAANLAGG